MKFFPKTFALLGGLTLASAIMPAPSHAVFIQCVPTNALGLWNLLAPNDTCTVGDKKLTILQNTISNPSGLLTFNSPTGMPEVHTLTATGGSFDNSGIFQYSIEVVSSPLLIKSLSFTNGSSLTTPSLPNYTWGIGIAGDVPGGFSYTGTGSSINPNPTLTMASISPNQSKITVTHNYNIGTGAPMQQFTDTIMQTPGPLPILGAGAAFGFSRKMRRRINSAV
jgi:hypothetical protein